MMDFSLVVGFAFPGLSGHVGRDKTITNQVIVCISRKGVLSCYELDSEALYSDLRLFQILLFWTKVHSAV